MRVEPVTAIAPQGRYTLYTFSRSKTRRARSSLSETFLGSLHTTICTSAPCSLAYSAVPRMDVVSAVAVTPMRRSPLPTPSSFACCAPSTA